MTDLGMDDALISSVLDPLQLRVVAFDATQARAAGLLRDTTRSLGLSLGDRACLALAAQLGATALTTDRAWAKLGGGVGVVLAR
jgi:PIN domain nuclease of toxin-antitoxin system